MEKTGFGWTAPEGPVHKQTPEVPWQLREVIECDRSRLEPARDFSHPDSDPVAGIVKGKEDKSAATTEAYQKLAKLLFAPSDSRVPVAPLRKDASPAASDWSWSTSIGGGLTLGKSATGGTAKARFEQQLAEFFRGHDKELIEARDVVSQALADERSAILSEEAV